MRFVLWTWWMMPVRQPASQPASHPNSQPVFVSADGVCDFEEVAAVPDGNSKLTFNRLPFVDVRLCGGALWLCELIDDIHQILFDDFWFFFFPLLPPFECVWMHSSKINSIDCSCQSIKMFFFLLSFEWRFLFIVHFKVPIIANQNWLVRMGIKSLMKSK